MTYVITYPAPLHHTPPYRQVTWQREERGIESVLNAVWTWRYYPPHPSTPHPTPPYRHGTWQREESGIKSVLRRSVNMTVPTNTIQDKEKSVVSRACLTQCEHDDVTHPTPPYRHGQREERGIKRTQCEHDVVTHPMPHPTPPCRRRNTRKLAAFYKLSANYSYNYNYYHHFSYNYTTLHYATLVRLRYTTRTTTITTTTLPNTTFNFKTATTTPMTLPYTTLHYTTLHYTTLHSHYTVTTQSLHSHYTVTTQSLHSHYTTLHYTTLHYTTLHYTQNITLPLQLQLQLDQTTLHPAVVGEETAATIGAVPENRTPTTFRSIHGFALPSMHHNNSRLPYCPIWNFLHRLVRYYWYIVNIKLKGEGIECLSSVGFQFVPNLNQASGMGFVGITFHGKRSDTFLCVRSLITPAPARPRPTHHVLSQFEVWTT